MRHLSTAAALIVSLLAFNAQSATLTASSTLSAGELAAATTPGLAPTATLGAVDLNVTGSIATQRRSPFDTIPALADTGVYNAVRAGGVATYSFMSPQTSFDLIWGSPDTFNRLVFFLGGAPVDLGAFGANLTGDEIVAAAGLAELGRGVASVSVTDIVFDEVLLGSTMNAFEFTVPGAPSVIPLPAAGWLSLAGLGVLFLARRRGA